MKRLVIPKINYDEDKYGDGYLSLCGLLLDDAIDHRWLDKLPLHWRLIVKMRFGLGYEPKSMEQLADILETDKESIRQIQNKAFGYLLDFFKCAEIQRDLEMKGWLELDEN